MLERFSPTLMPAAELEALILIKTVPGKTMQVVTYLAEEDEKKKGVYRERAVREVYQASGKFDVIVHVATKDAKELFKLVDKIRSWPEENTSDSTESTANNTCQKNVSEIEPIVLVHKAMGDP